MRRCPESGPDRPFGIVGVFGVLLAGMLVLPAGASGPGADEAGLAGDEWTREDGWTEGDESTGGGTWIRVGGDGTAASSLACEDHPPIVIVGDEGPLSFTVVDPETGAHSPRPGSGVRGGQGTPEDPFVIEGWCIGAASASGGLGVSAVHLERTSAHVVIRGNVLEGAAQDPVEPDGVAVRLSKSDNVRVEGNVLRAGDSGVVVEEAMQVEVAGNQVVGGGASGVVVSRSSDVRLEGNLVSDRRVGVEVTEGLRVHLHSNQVTGSGSAAFAVEDSLDTQVWNNSLVLNPGIALYLSGSERALVANNDLSSGGQGVYLWSGVRDVLLRNNTIEDNQWEGVVAVSSPSNTLRGNNIVGNDIGVWAARSPGLDLEGNWWGCPDGPGGPGCDTVDPEVAPGSWLDEENPVAGPGHDDPWRLPPEGPVPDETHTWSGFLGCSLNYPTAFQPWTCPDPDNDVEHTFTVRPGLKSLVVAMEWSQVDTCTGAELRHWLYVPAEAERATSRHQEASPIEYRVDEGDPMGLPFEQIEEPTQLRFRVWGPSHSLHVCHGQPFSVHYHLFYEGQADEGYSALP